jgi:hypothetical protein
VTTEFGQLRTMGVDRSGAIATVTMLGRDLDGPGMVSALEPTSIEAEGLSGTPLLIERMD